MAEPVTLNRGPKQVGISFGGSAYKLALYDAQAPTAAAWGVGREHLPRAIVEALDPSADFPSRAHRLRRWFGVVRFLVISPVRNRSDLLASHGATASEATSLLSCLQLALVACDCDVPAYVPYVLARSLPGSLLIGTHTRFLLPTAL